LKLIIKPSNNSRISLISLNTIKGLYRHIKRRISFTKADASVILAFRMTFNNYQQALQVKNSELEVKIQQAIAEAEARRVAQLWQDKLTLTNTALATATSAEVDANNAVNGLLPHYSQWLKQY
jgi:hypothetical protein